MHSQNEWVQDEDDGIRIVVASIDEDDAEYDD